MNSFAKQALEEYNSSVTTAHHGGVDGRPFWNAHSSQFTFNPAFLFPKIPSAVKYLFTATDCNGENHSFEADKPTSLLTPIWGEIPTGMVELKVEAFDKDGKALGLSGVRTFFKCAPFPGRENYPEKARTYTECVRFAYKFFYEQPATQYWLEHGTPDPDYDFNVYPSKTVSSVVTAMIKCSEIMPENAENAIKIASAAADYLISITYGEDSPLAGLPPTYYTAFREEGAQYHNGGIMAETHADKVMLVYPADAGCSYLELAEATGEKRFFDAAKGIADYYKNHVCPNGSWKLFVTEKTGDSVAHNYCIPDRIMKFMSKMYKTTGEQVWQDLAQGCYKYIEKNCIEGYNWEGQFEDAPLSDNYSNLTHFSANNIIKYISENYADNEEYIKVAEDLMRFVEDQFVVWGKYPSWLDSRQHWFSPAGLEQYNWYLPIDGSTGRIMDAFLDMYLLTKKPLYLEKARALGDMITRMQNPENGMLPTHWLYNKCWENPANLWINCHVGTANNLMRMVEFED